MPKSGGYIEWVGCEDVVRTRTTHAVITDDRAAQLKCRLHLSGRECNPLSGRECNPQINLDTTPLNNDWIDQSQPIHK